MTEENLNDLEKLKAFMEELGQVQDRYIEDLEKRIEQLTEINEDLQEKNDQLVAENDRLKVNRIDRTTQPVTPYSPTNPSETPYNPWPNTSPYEWNKIYKTTSDNTSSSYFSNTTLQENFNEYMEKFNKIIEKFKGDLNEE